MASTLTDFENLFLQLVNEARAVAGANALAVYDELVTAARGHGAWMDATDTFSHTGVNGSDPGERVFNSGYGAQAWGENIAYVSGPLTEATVRQLHENLMNSPGHYENIVRGFFEEIGIALKEGTINGHDVVFVTQDFGAPNAAERAEPDSIGTVSTVEEVQVSGITPTFDLAPVGSETTSDIGTIPKTDVTPVVDATPAEVTAVTNTPSVEGTETRSDATPVTEVTPETGATPDISASPTTGEVPDDATTPATVVTEDSDEVTDGNQDGFNFGGWEGVAFKFLCHASDTEQSDTGTTQDHQYQIDLTDFGGSADEALTHLSTFLSHTEAEVQSIRAALHDAKLDAVADLKTGAAAHDFAVALKDLALKATAGDFHI